MTKQERILKEYTHLAEIYGIRCYYNEFTHEIEGTNWFNDIMIDVCIWVDQEFEFSQEEGFKITLIKRLSGGIL